MPWTGTKTATIANNAQISDAVDLAEQRLAGINVPANWVAANITFQTSIDGVAFFDVYDSNGAVSIPQGQLANARMVLVDPSTFFGLRYLKLKTSAVQNNGDVAVTLMTAPR